MKKNKLIYIILSLIILFGYKENVYADLKTEAASKSCEKLIEDGTIDTKSETFLFDGSHREANCLYVMTETYKEIGFGKLKTEVKHFPFVKEKNRCIIFQIAFDKNGEFDAKSYGKTGLSKYYSGQTGLFQKNKAKELNKDYIATLNGICPVQIEYKTTSDGNMVKDSFYIGSTKKNMRRVHKTDIHVTIPPLVSELNEEVGESSCKDILGEKGIGILKTIKTLLQVAIPILLLVLGSLDFGTAIFAGDENEMKKSQQKFVKRVIFSVVIFLIPPILGVVLDMAHQIWPVIDASLCGIYD